MSGRKLLRKPVSNLPQDLLLRLHHRMKRGTHDDAEGHFGAGLSLQPKQERIEIIVLLAGEQTSFGDVRFDLARQRPWELRGHLSFRNRPDFDDRGRWRFGE